MRINLYLATLHPQEYSQTHQLAKTIAPELPLSGILLSYHYCKGISIADALSCFGETPPAVFLDSGAFSMMTQGIPIDLACYARYIQENMTSIIVYANLDVIKQAEQTYRNQRALEQYGLTPLPVFHVGEPFSYLDAYVKAYPSIALGVAGTSYHVYMPWLVKCFAHIPQETRVHGFGITAWDALSAFPWYSVDSSSWNRAGRFGRFLLFDEKKKCLQEMYVGKHESAYKRARALRQFAIDPAQLAANTKTSHQLANALSLIAFEQAFTWLEQRKESL